MVSADAETWSGGCISEVSAGGESLRVRGLETRLNHEGSIFITRARVEWAKVISKKRGTALKNHPTVTSWEPIGIEEKSTEMELSCRVGMMGALNCPRVGAVELTLSLPKDAPFDDLLSERGK